MNPDSEGVTVYEALRHRTNNEDAEDDPTELMADCVATVVVTASQGAASLGELSLDDAHEAADTNDSPRPQPTTQTPADEASVDHTPQAGDDAHEAAEPTDSPASTDRPVETAPNAQVSVTSNSYRTPQLALLAALALVSATTRYFTVAPDASGSDAVAVSTVPSASKPQPVDAAFEAAKRTASDELRGMVSHAYAPTCERLPSSALDARQDALKVEHAKIEHKGRPDLTVPAHVDFAVAPLGATDSVLCWTQHPGITHPGYRY